MDNELRFLNPVDELQDKELMHSICEDLLKLQDTFHKQVARIAKRNNVSLSVETYFNLKKGKENGQQS